MFYKMLNKIFVLKIDGSLVAAESDSHVLSGFAKKTLLGKETTPTTVSALKAPPVKGELYSPADFSHNAADRIAKMVIMELRQMAEDDSGQGGDKLEGGSQKRLRDGGNGGGAPALKEQKKMAGQRSRGSQEDQDVQPGISDTADSITIEFCRGWHTATFGTADETSMVRATLAVSAFSDKTPINIRKGEKFLFAQIRGKLTASASQIMGSGSA